MTTACPAIYKNNLDYRTLQFFYGEATFQNYSSQHVQAGWENRKLTAIPKGLYTGVVLTIYEIASAIFLQVTRGTDLTLLQLSAYRVFRNLQAATGYLLTIFNDCLGSYLVATAGQHLNWYTLFEKLSHFPSGEVPQEVLQDPNFLYYLNMTDEELLSVSLKDYTQKNCHPIVFLRLTKIPLVPGYVVQDKSQMTLKDLIHLSGEKLDGVPEECWALLRKEQLALVDYSKITFENWSKMFPDMMGTEMNAKRFAAIPPKHINQLIPLPQLCFITVDQIKQKNFDATDLTNFDSWFQQIIQKRGKHIAEQLFAALHEDVVNFVYGSLTPDVKVLCTQKQLHALKLNHHIEQDALDQLDLSQFKDEQIICIAHMLSVTPIARVSKNVDDVQWEDVEAIQLKKGFEAYPFKTQEFFKNASKETLDKLLPKLGVYFLKHASDEQIEEADLTLINIDFLADSIHETSLPDTEKQRLLQRLPQEIQSKIDLRV